MDDTKTEKFHATWGYLLMLVILISLAVACFYFVEDKAYRVVLAAVPILLLLTAKNSVIEVHADYFLLKNYFLLIRLKQRRYFYADVAFVHYHRHAHLLMATFDFWGLYKQKPIEVRYKNQTFASVPIYGVRAILLRGVQAVNEHIHESTALKSDAHV